LNTFVNDVHGVDDTILGLHGEVQGLSQVLHNIELKWKDPLFHRSQADLEGELWQSVLESLIDCKGTLLKLQQRLKDLQESNRFLNRGIFRRPATAVKLNFSMKDILAFKQRVCSHASAMHIALSMINL
jgi:hypothetical protein